MTITPKPILTLPMTIRSALTKPLVGRVTEDGTLRVTETGTTRVTENH